MPDRHEPELLDAFFDTLALDLKAPAPTDLASDDAELARTLAALEHAAREPGAETAARIWTRVLQSVPAAIGEPPTTQLASVPAPSRVTRRRRRPDYTPWLRTAAAVSLIALIGAAALGLSSDAQAQVRRLTCLVPGLGVRACDSPGLVSTQTVYATSNGLSVQVLGLQASSAGTLVRMRLSGLPVPGPVGTGQEQRFEDSVPFVQAVQALQVQLRDSETTTAAPVAPAGQPWPGTSPSVPRWARVLSYWMEPASDGTWRLAVTAEWAFAPLDANVRSVDVAIPAPPGPLAITVPLVPVQSASLPTLGAEGGEVTQHGVALRVAGITDSSSGLILQVTGRGASPAERVVGLGKIEPGQPGVWGRMLWDNQGHQYAEASAGPADARSEGDTYLQTLTFPTMPAPAYAATLEVPGVFVLEDAATASVTIPVDGQQPGENINLDTKLAFGNYPLLVRQATIQAATNGRELVVELDFGDVQDGRALLGTRIVRVSGRDDLHPRVTGDDPTGRYQMVHVPLPLDIGPQVTLTFSGAFAEVRGPWRLPVPPPPIEQP